LIEGASVKYLYDINKPVEDASPDLLGGKGYHLMNMVGLGVPVPPAFILSTDLCRKYMTAPKTVMKEVRQKLVPQIIEGLSDSDGTMPLVSIRSGSKFSMPGMMDTILNVGLCPENASYWKDMLGEQAFTNSYLRLISMFADVVHKVSVSADSVPMALSVYEGAVGTPFPDPVEQIVQSIEAVLKSWDNERAKTYRKMNGIPDDLGTAVIIQRMVFGNLNEDSCTGVLFTRNPSSGEDEVVGEYLVQAQGEEVVAGIRTPQPLSGLAGWNLKIFKQLAKQVCELEAHYRDMQDVEFTVEDGKLWILQTRSGKRTARAAVRIALEMVESGMISQREVLSRVTFQQVLDAMRPEVDPKFDVPPAFTGIPASPGVVTGKVVYSSEEAVESKEPCILLAKETTPEDIKGMAAAVGILTATGGATSHAAVVARGMNRAAVVGCSTLQYSVKDGWRSIQSGDLHFLPRGTKVTLDGATGRVWVDAMVPVIRASEDLVGRLAGLVRDLHPYLPVATTISEVKATGNWVLAWEMAPDEVKLAAETMATGVLDFSDPYSTLSSVDREWMNAFVQETKDPLKVAIVLKKLPVTSKVLYLRLPTPKSESLQAAAEAKGYKVLGDAGDLKDLIMATVPVAMDQTLVTPEVARLLALREKAGEPLEMISLVSEATPGVGNVRLAMTDIAALQSFMKG